MDRVSARHLRDIDETRDFDAENDRDEIRLYRFVRRHFDDHQVIPSREIVESNTAFILPEINEEQPIEYYMNRLRQRAMTRHIINPYNRLQEALQRPQSSVDDMLESIDELYSVKSQFADRGSGIETSEGLVRQVIDAAAARRMIGDTLTGITTGYAPLDHVIDGYNRDDLIVWVARPGRGKSWLLLKQCHAAWLAGWKPLYVSMEMGGLANMRRMMGIHSGINPTLIKRGKIGTLAQPILDGAAAELLALRPLHMVTANFSRTVDSIAQLIDQHTPDICYIDAGYLLSPRKKRSGSGGRRETISDVIEELKELGANSGIPIVITVQFNRSAEQRRRGSNAARREGSDGPTDPLAHLSLAEIGETDAIGQTASHVLGIEYPPYPIPQNMHRVFGFLKGREGEQGWWLTNYMQSQHSPIDLSLVPLDSPIYAAIRNGSQQTARNRPAGQRSAAMALQD